MTNDDRMNSDDRMTYGLIIDMLDVLERHGYHRYDSQHTGKAVGAIFELAYIYDGTRDVSYGYHAPSAPHAAPGPADPEADDAVILTGAEASIVAAALDVAADYERDRAAACADCADQTCFTCQTRLIDAETYDQVATQKLRAPKVAAAQQARPDRAQSAESQSQKAADREAGQ